MAYVIADHIISPLGGSSEENYLSVKTGKSMLRAYEAGWHGVQEEFCASLTDGDFSEIEDAATAGTILRTPFERLAFASAKQAMRQSGIDVVQHRVVFILSTTKGAIEQLGKVEDEELFLGAIARHIATALGIKTKPVVVCNACISGLSALILASRLLDADVYDYAVVCGADSPRRFIISGFQSLKALSTAPCRPFDMERNGLNLGEAAATLVLGRTPLEEHAWQMGRGTVRNDAFHISAPSKTSEGLFACLQQTLQGMMPSDIGFVNAHGTATLFNDQMESVAIQRAGLSQVPANALKGYLGHTLGAAGILETILSMKAADDHLVVGTKGFEELGVSGQVNISAESRPTDKSTFVKMLSGFGGCNATLLVSKSLSPRVSVDACSLGKRHHVLISCNAATVDDKLLKINDDAKDGSILTAIYRQYVGNYPKYYKMDGLSRLGFIATELLLSAEAMEAEVPQKAGKHADDRAVILFNRSSSLVSDKKYLASITDETNYFPSPSTFVYTLPNIVTGEIAIRNGYHGETSFYVLADKDEAQMQEILQTAFQDSQTQSAITGWIDYEDAEHFEADLYIVERR